MIKSRAIASARAFLNDKSFEILTDITNLNPLDDWKNWQDSEGNRLVITKQKRIYVYKSKSKPETTKDIFRNSTPDLIAKYSYWIMAFLDSKKSVLCFLGNDGILRCCYFENKRWINNFPPLLLGYKALKYISSGYIDDSYRTVKGLKINQLNNRNVERVFVSGYPIPDHNLQENIKCHLINQNSKV